MYYICYKERKRIAADSLKNSITPRECAITATTNSVGLRNLGTVHIINFMQMGCAKTAI